MTPATSTPPTPPSLIARLTRKRDIERERLALRYARRTVTVPVYLASFLINTAAAPIFLVVALTGDLARRRGTIFVRCILALWAYLAVETFGLLLFLPLWLLGQGSEHRRLALHHWFARVWARWVFWSIVRLFEMRVVVEGDKEAAVGPVIVFCRHVSPVDNLLPLVFLEGRHGLWLRWVMNSWLVRDPCIDFVGHRLRSVFLTVGSREGSRLISKVSAMGNNLEPREGVLVFPEGALFTPRRLARAVARLAEGLRHVLPPQLGGPLALLDVVFCAHTGLEGGSYRSLLAGGILRREVRIAFWRVPRDFRRSSAGRAVALLERAPGSRCRLLRRTPRLEGRPRGLPRRDARGRHPAARAVRIAFWRVPRDEVPADMEGRTAWLHAQWRRVDLWIEENALSQD